MMSWDIKNVSYRIDGKYIQEQNLMLFDLNKAKIEKR